MRDNGGRFPSKDNHVAILHGAISPEAPADEQDTLVEVEAVSQALEALGYQPTPITFSVDLPKVMTDLKKVKPQFIFNLVESVESVGRLVHLAPALFDFLQIPYTGAPTEAIFLTSNKVLSKKLMVSAGIPTPAWIADIGDNSYNVPLPKPLIIKSIWEHASVGLDDYAVVHDLPSFKSQIEKRLQRVNGGCFAEEYINGREFNLAIIGSAQELQTLPPAEICFLNYPKDKPKLVDYRAKWEPESFEYQNTQRKFDFPESDRILISKLKEIATHCWKTFGLRGYARVDFRVDSAYNPWVLEINSNPCLSPDGGFAAAASLAGLNYQDIIQRIVQNVNRHC